MAHHIETEALTKFYGRQRGVEELTLSVGPGEVFGFLGPNGAGKTTTIRLLTDLIRPTSGTVRVLGYDPRKDPVMARRHVGCLPGDLELYRDMSGRELLAFLASLRPGADLEYAGELAGRLDLDLSRRVHDLSKGNKQKLGVVQAFHAPARPADPGRAVQRARPAGAAGIPRADPGDAYHQGVCAGGG